MTHGRTQVISKAAVTYPVLTCLLQVPWNYTLDLGFLPEGKLDWKSLVSMA